MGRTKGNLGRGVPARINNPPNTAMNPEWWKDGANLLKLHPNHIERKKYEKKQQKKQQP